MLFPQSHFWTTRQKLLIVGGGASVLILLAALVYGYERHYRGAGEEAFYGTWQMSDFPSDEPAYFDFRADQTFSICDVFEGKLNPFITGKWYAGGPNIYLRFTDEMMEGQRPVIAHIVDISPNQIRIRWSLSRDSTVRIWKKVVFPSAAGT